MLALLLSHHELVYRLCLKEVQSRAGETKRFLEQLLNHYHTNLNKPFPISKGSFCGDILITDSPTFEEEWSSLPTDSGSTVKVITKIPYSEAAGKQIKIIPLLSGLALDENLNGDVIYGMNIVGPDGVQVESARGMIGVKRRISSRFLIQAAEEWVELSFQFLKKEAFPVDEGSLITRPGLYKIQGTLKDIIGKKEITIHKTLEILPP